MTTGTLSDKTPSPDDNPATPPPEPPNPLKVFRNYFELTQKSFARTMGYAEEIISSIESGKRRVSRELAEAMADYAIEHYAVLPINRSAFVDAVLKPADLAPFFDAVRPRMSDAVLVNRGNMAALDDRLPAQWFGYEGEIKRIDDERRHTLISGLPGSGKTALAAFVIKCLVEETNGAAVVFHLGTLDSKIEFYDLLRALLKPFPDLKFRGSREVIDKSIDLAAARLNEFGPVALLIDNLVMDASPEARGHFANLLKLIKKLKFPVVITSRVQPTLPTADLDGFTLPALGEMEPQAAAAMLHHHSGEGTLTDRQAARISKRLGHHPLGIEYMGGLLGEWQRNNPSRTIDEFLNDHPNLLDPPRRHKHRAIQVEELLTWSLMALGEAGAPQGSVAGKSAAKAPPDPADLLRAIVALGAPTAPVAVIATYLDKASIAGAQLEPLLRLHLIRQFPAGPERAVDALAIHPLLFAHLARQKDSAPNAERTLIALAALRKFQDTLKKAAAKSTSDARATQTLRDLRTDLHAMRENVLALGDRIWPTAPAPPLTPPTGHMISLLAYLAEAEYFDHFGADAGMERLLDIASDLACLDPSLTRAAHWLCAKLGNFHLHTQMFEEAGRRYAIAVETAPDLNRKIRMNSVLASVLAAQGRYDEAISTLDEAEAMASAVNDADALSRVFEHRGNIAYQRAMAEEKAAHADAARSNYEAARQWYEAMLFQGERIDNAYTKIERQMFASLNLSDITGGKLSDPQHGLLYASRCLELADTMDSDQYRAHAHNELGQNHCRLSHRDETVHHLREAYRLYEKIGNRPYCDDVLAFAESHGINIM